MRNSKALENMSNEIFGIMKSFSRLDIYAFTHDITFVNNRSSILSNIPNMRRDYEEKNIPFVCMKDGNRDLQSGIHLSTVLTKTRQDFRIPQSMAQSHFGFENSLSFAEKKSDHFNFYTFCFRKDEATFLNHVLNNFNDLNLFLLEYKKSVSKVELSQLAETSFQPSTFKNLDKKNFFVSKVTKKPIPLSVKQKACVFHLANGLTTKEIAKEMNLSSRTVEFYLGIIKEKLECDTLCGVVHYLTKEQGII